LRKIAPAIKAEGVTRLAVFGSRARGDARPDSDLDILVDTVPRGISPAFDLFKVMHLIEDATGVQTQISMRDLLKPRITERIADDLVGVLTTSLQPAFSLPGTPSIAPRDAYGLLFAAVSGNDDVLGGAARHIGVFGRRIAMGPIPGNIIFIGVMNVARWW
jgi:predicted nucleotidyltransferase